MKSLFNHTKKETEEWEGYDATDYDWDDPGEYGEEQPEYYAEQADDVYPDENGEYYSEEEYADDSGEYYAEEVHEDATEYYTDENGEFYAEDTEDYYEEAADGTYTDDNGEYYAEEGDEYYEEDDSWYEEVTPVAVTVARPKKPVKSNRRKKNVFVVLWMKFMDMGVMDRIITATGIAVLILALVTGGLYVSSKSGEDSTSELATVGLQLEGINLIGEQGLMAVADAEIARRAAAEIVQEEEEQKEYDEEEYANAVSVKLNMTSVKKDLKIKFTNKETGKLISNVPFSVTVTKPNGTSVTWEDDDMDGIIYYKNIDAGTYKVLVNELTGEKYADYTIPEGTQSVEVKKDIAYEKIDVSDEVKTEAEINVALEDTKKNETVVESTLQDTVTWVESTSVAETYTEVSKSTIPDPTTLAMNKSFLRTAANVTAPSVTGNDAGVAANVAFKASVAPTETTLAVGKTATAKVTATDYTQGKTLKYSVVSDKPDIAKAEIDAAGNITITGVAAGTATVTATVNYAEGESFPTTAALKVTVMDKPVITVDKTSAKVYLSQPVTINAKVANAITGAAITAESSNTGVATVAVNGSAVTITGVAAGDATITVKYAENGQETQATCVVKVVAHPKDNTTDKLKDVNGTQLYVLENDKYREAVYADYYTAEKFFIKGDVKYTGWQTIGGNVYYFTASGEKVTGEQIIQGAKYNFASDGSLITGSGTMGIDVSKWNGKIDWNAVKNSGVSYVIIRCGYRGSSQGMLVEDPKFETNIKGALDAGLKVGVYFFTQATDEIEAVEEASFVLDQIKNYKISYPVFLDVEPSGGRGDKIDKSTRTAVCKAFCETIQRGGYTAGIYANKTWLNEKIDAGSLSAYKIWLAQYAATPTYTGRYDMWQYSCKGKVSGISGDVDLNLSYLGY